MTRTQAYIIGIQNKLNRHGFKISDLVRATGLSSGAFTQWKNGANRIRQSSIDKIDAAVETMLEKEDKE